MNKRQTHGGARSGAGRPRESRRQYPAPPITVALTVGEKRWVEDTAKRLRCSRPEVVRRGLDALRLAEASGADGRQEKNERLRQEFEQMQTDVRWMSQGPKHTSPVAAAHEMGFKEAVSRLRVALAVPHVAPDDDAPAESCSLCGGTYPNCPCAQV